MSASLALYLCTLFVLVVLVLDVKSNPETTWSTWIPLIWLMTITARPLNSWFSGEGLKNYYSQEAARVQIEIGSPITRTTLAILILCGLFLLIKRRLEWGEIFRANPWIAIWLLYTLLSVVWSDYPSVSLKRWIKSISTPVMVMLIMTEPRPWSALNAIFRRCAYILVPFSILLIKYFRESGLVYSPWGGGGSFAGVTSDKNALGRICMILIVFFLLGEKAAEEKVNNEGVLIKIINKIILVFTTWLLILTNSATALLSGLAGLGVYLALGNSAVRRKPDKLRFHIPLIVMCLLVVFFLGYKIFMGSIIAATGHEATFMGRTVLWKSLLEMNTPVLTGTGYGSFWFGNRLDLLWETYWWKPTESHNGYLEVYLELGLVGVLILGGLFKSAFRKFNITVSSDFDRGRLMFALLTIIAMYNIPEAAFGGIDLMMFLFLFISADVASNTSA